jgi:cytochrome c oxidase subunit II
MKRPAAGLFSLLMLSNCARAPLGYLEGAGPAARSIASLGWGLLGISVAVCLITGALLVFSIFRRRAQTDGLRSGDDKSSLRWIGVGLSITTVLLLASAVWTLWTVRGLSDTSRAAAVTIDVTGQQWWWEVRYRSDTPSREFSTANDLVIPAGVPVQLNLRSRDVVHSFWVPKLAGKMDMIPGQTNRIRIEADRPGIYRGQCSEFCGVQHAQMAFSVIALAPADFQTWWNHQLEPASNDPTAAPQQIFMERCSSCHAIRGLPAGGILGPNLSHFGSRRTIAAGVLPNDSGDLAHWLNDSQGVKPGSKMPELHLAANQIDALTAYLEGLK